MKSILSYVMLQLRHCSELVEKYGTTLSVRVSCPDNCRASIDLPLDEPASTERDEKENRSEINSTMHLLH